MRVVGSTGLCGLEQDRASTMKPGSQPGSPGLSRCVISCAVHRKSRGYVLDDVLYIPNSQ